MARVLTNDAIVASVVTVVDERGSDLGRMDRSRALTLARERGCDLVQDGSYSSPPLCRLQPAGQAAVEAAREARIERGGPPKEIRVGAAMGAHDLEARRRQAASLLSRGYTIKLSARLSKGERANPVAARTLLLRLADDLAADGRPAGKPFGESGALSLVMAPI